MFPSLRAAPEQGRSQARICEQPRSLCRLKLNEKVSLEKIRFFCMDHDGGSVFVSPVDKEILQAQKKVGRKGEKILLLFLITAGTVET